MTYAPDLAARHGLYEEPPCVRCGRAPRLANVADVCGGCLSDARYEAGRAMSEERGTRAQRRYLVETYGWAGWPRGPRGATHRTPGSPGSSVGAGATTGAWDVIE